MNTHGTKRVYVNAFSGEVTTKLLTIANKFSEREVNIFGSTFTSGNTFTLKVRLRAY
jgi:hypothetical protein